MRSISRLKDYIREEAEEYEFELDAIREIEDEDTDGVTLRIIAEDGETEADQVGFQVLRPNINQGRSVFNQNVLAGLRELRDHYRDDRDGDTSRDLDPSNEQADIDQLDDDTGNESSSTVTPSNSTQQQQDPLGPLGVELTIDEESEEDLIAEFESLVEEIEEITVSESDLEELVERVDEIETRLTNLEEQLSMIGN